MRAVETLIGRFVDVIVNPLILLVFAAGFFRFIWGLVQFLFHLEEGGKHEEGVQHMIWGVVGMFVMVAVYGIIMLMNNTFNLGIFGPPDLSRLNSLNIPSTFFGR
jgi:ABC-type phosphate transport system permease subunit